MAFWSAGTTEPKRQFRWTFTLGLGTPGSNIETYFVKTVKKPSFTVGEIEHQYVAHRFYYPGRITWNPVDVTFVDPVAPDTSAILSNIVVDSGYEIPVNEVVAQRSFSKGKFIDSVGTPTIEQIDADGVTIERWTLNNAFITNLDYGQLDYTVDELVIVAMTLRYDYATLDMTTTPSRLTG